MISRRTIRIGNVSGATGEVFTSLLRESTELTSPSGDAPHALRRMLLEGNIDVITGDWLSEMNIAWNSIAKAQDPSTGYDLGFLEQIAECVEVIADKQVKIVTNAGALNPLALSYRIADLCKAKGLSHLSIATVVGDDMTHMLEKSETLKYGNHFTHLDDEAICLDEWNNSLKPSCAVAYIGAWGIVGALEAGADIVICGRVTDASPVIGAAAWWYGWSRSAYDQLAGALIAGHIIECGPYAVGANFSGFKQYLGELVDLGFPIAEIEGDGTFVVTKAESMNGVVEKSVVTAQLLYELQGELYLNPDVVADISRVEIQNVGKNRVYVSGVRGLLPPDSTKVMVAAPGGYQAEATYYINGLDVDAKAQMMEQQLRHVFQESNFSKFSVESYGFQAANPRAQREGTTMLRVFVQARNRCDISNENFKRSIYALRMQSYPGYHMNLDFRTMNPKPFMEIFPTTVAQSLIEQKVIFHGRNRTLHVEIPLVTTKYSTVRPSYETRKPIPIESFGPTTEAPLGSIVHARSGDKANNCNVGFFVRHEDEYSWLQNLLTIDHFKLLLEDDYDGQKVERVEFPLIWAVHFRILEFLDGGIASSSRIDGLGKGVGEYLRSKHVQVPIKFLSKGTI